MTQVYYETDRARSLPPLILHPFSDSTSPSKLAQSSRAGLMLQGLLPNEEYSIEQLERIVLDGKNCEIRMLFYVGRDLCRWIEQCMEVVERELDLRGSAIARQSFASMLVDEAPAHIKEKLATWGVQDYRSIFSRAIGLNSVFAELPQPESLSPEFVKNYHFYADQLYNCWRGMTNFSRIRPANFRFELYASGEYSRMLEMEWTRDPGCGADDNLKGWQEGR